MNWEHIAGSKFQWQNPLGITQKAGIKVMSEDYTYVESQQVIEMSGGVQKVKLPVRKF